METLDAEDSTKYTKLAEQFMPVLYFHKKEKFFPVSIEEYLSKCCLIDRKDPNMKIAMGDVKKEDLFLYNDGNHDLLICDENIEHNELYYFIHIYAKVVETDEFYYISYYLIFLNNPGYNICCWKDVGGHKYDLEHITIKVNKVNNILDTCFFSAHDDGEMHPLKNIEFQEGHPVVYIAKNSHATYNSPKTHYRIWFVANDKCRKHITMFQSLHLLGNESWESFIGSMSQDGGSLMCTRRWYNEPWLEQQERSRLNKIFRFK